MSAVPAPSAPSGWRTPTSVHACADAILLIVLGIRQGSGLVLEPIYRALGRGRETQVVAIALQNLMGSLEQPFFGAIADRFGAGHTMPRGSA